MPPFQLKNVQGANKRNSHEHGDTGSAAPQQLQAEQDGASGLREPLLWQPRDRPQELRSPSARRGQQWRRSRERGSVPGDTESVPHRLQMTPRRRSDASAPRQTRRFSTWPPTWGAASFALHPNLSGKVSERRATIRVAARGQQARHFVWRPRPASL